MWAGLDLASGSASEEVVEPGGCRHLIGMRLGGLRTGSQSSRDLGFERANRPAGFNSARGEFTTSAMIRLGQQRLPVALRQCAGVDQLDRFVGEVEQADGVREVAAAAAEPPREDRRGDAELVEERRDRASFLDDTEVLSGDVLDQRELDGVTRFDGLGDERRDRRDAGDLRGAPAPLAGDQLVSRRPRGAGR